MILVDTSVWVDHLRAGVPALAAALEQTHVLAHPFRLRYPPEKSLAVATSSKWPARCCNSSESCQAPQSPQTVAFQEFIERHALMGRGIGYIDIHLLASATLAGAAKLLDEGSATGRSRRGSPPHSFGAEDMMS